MRERDGLAPRTPDVINGFFGNGFFGDNGNLLLPLEMTERGGAGPFWKNKPM